MDAEAGCTRTIFALLGLEFWVYGRRATVQVKQNRTLCTDPTYYCHSFSSRLVGIILEKLNMSFNFKKMNRSSEW
jgi:hypothetical protein